MEAVTLAASRRQLTAAIKTEAQRLGFTCCGAARAEALTHEARELEQWLQQGKHGTMHYMGRYFDERTDPRKLVAGAKTVLSLLANYYPAETLPARVPKISRYAYGQDYHWVLKRKLTALMDFISERCGPISARSFVDSGPVMEKAWAQRAGLGWIGKNTNLIRPQAGSYFFIAEIILEVELEYDLPTKDYCGSCTRCIDACPTQALTPYKLDANRCIAYLTIELKDNMPAAYQDKLAGWAYGCDICQEVCPWNSFATPHAEPAFAPQPHTLLSQKAWEALGSNQYEKLTRPTAMSRIPRGKWLDNLAATQPALDTCAELPF